MDEFSELLDQYFANLDFDEKRLICTIENGDIFFDINVDGYEDDHPSILEEEIGSIFDGY